MIYSVTQHGEAGEAAVKYWRTKAERFKAERDAAIKQRDELLECLLYLRDYHVAMTTDLIDNYVNKALEARGKKR